MSFEDRKSFLMATSMKVLMTAPLSPPSAAVKKKLHLEAVTGACRSKKTSDREIILSLLTSAPGHDIFNSSQSSFIIYRLSADAHLLIECWNLGWQCNYTRNVAIPPCLLVRQSFSGCRNFFISPLPPFIKLRIIAFHGLQLACLMRIYLRIWISFF